MHDSNYLIWRLIFGCKNKFIAKTTMKQCFPIPCTLTARLDLWPSLAFLSVPIFLLMWYFVSQNEQTLPYPYLPSTFAACHVTVNNRHFAFVNHTLKNEQIMIYTSDIYSREKIGFYSVMKSFSFALFELKKLPTQIVDLCRKLKRSIRIISLGRKDLPLHKDGCCY